MYLITHIYHLPISHQKFRLTLSSPHIHSWTRFICYLTKSTNCMTLLNFPRIYKINCPHFISHIKPRCTSTSTWLSGFTYLFVFNKKVQHFLCIPLYFKLNCLTFIKMVAEKYDYIENNVVYPYWRCQWNRTTTLCIKFQVLNIKFLVVNCVYLNCNFVLPFLCVFISVSKYICTWVTRTTPPSFNRFSTKIYILLLVLHLLNYYCVICWQWWR